MRSAYLCELCYDQMTTHMTTAWNGHETAVCQDCLAPPVGASAWDGLVYCLVAGNWDEAQDWLRRSSLPWPASVTYVCAPWHLRGLRRPQVYLHGTYRQLPQWPEIAQALRNVQADVIAPDRDAPRARSEGPLGAPERRVRAFQAGAHVAVQKPSGGAALLAAVRAAGARGDGGSGSRSCFPVHK